MIFRMTPLDGSGVPRPFGRAPGTPPHPGARAASHRLARETMVKTLILLYCPLSINSLERRKTSMGVDFLAEGSQKRAYW